MSDESCFTTDTVTRGEVKKVISYRHLKTQKHSVRIGLPCSGFSFYEHCNREFTYAVFFILKTVKCVSVNRFYTNVVFRAAWNSRTVF